MRHLIARKRTDRRRTSVRAVCVRLSAVCATVAFGAPAALAQVQSLLSGTWQSLADFATLGQCANAPVGVGLAECHPARQAFVKRRRTEASAFLSASDILFEAADSIQRKDKLREAPIGKVLNETDHAEILADARLSYVTPWVSAGIHPYRVSGQFQLHNPNLPLASAVLRTDAIVSVTAAGKLEFHLGSAAFGVEINALRRKESVIEASLADLASQSSKEIQDRRTLRGLFADAGFLLELWGIVSVSLQAKDLGEFQGGSPRYDDYLYIYPDRTARLVGGLALLPSTAYGGFQLGVSYIAHLYEETDPKENSFFTVSYFMGPVKIMSALRPGLARTGLALSYGALEFSMAQEWKNDFQSRLGTRARLTAELALRM